MDVEIDPEYNYVQFDNDEKEINVGSVLDDIRIYLRRDDIFGLMQEESWCMEHMTGGKFDSQKVGIQLYYDDKYSQIDPERGRVFDDLLDAFIVSTSYLSIFDSKIEDSNEIISNGEMKKLFRTRRYYTNIRKEYK